MCNSQVHRNFWLALAAAALLIVAGCSNTANNEPTTTAKKVDTAKPAATAKPAPVAKASQPTTMVTVPKGTVDRKSTRLNSSHLVISYAVFCLKKKNK